MLVKTTRGGCIILEHTEMENLGKKVPAYLIYEKYPDGDHSHNSILNAEYYKVEEKMIEDFDVFKAIVETYQTGKAFDKLKDFGLIK